VVKAETKSLGEKQAQFSPGGGKRVLMRHGSTPWR
jgi:hypothetical protein